MLKRNHREIGHVVAETGEFTILQTAPHQFAAAPTNQLMPVSTKDAEFEIRMLASQIVERARFLEISMERVLTLLQEEAT